MRSLAEYELVGLETRSLQMQILTTQLRKMNLSLTKHFKKYYAFTLNLAMYLIK
jgi:hypothetical protein